MDLAGIATDQRRRVPESDPGERAFHLDGSYTRISTESPRVMSENGEWHV